MTQLFVLGNGFDLTLGLNSRYSDFYNDYVLSRISKSDINYLEVSFWELLLGKNDKNWVDIENKIEKILVEINAKNFFNLTLNDIIRRINDDDSKIKEFLLYFLKHNKGNIMVHDTKLVDSDHLDNNKRLMFGNFLLNQLAELERHFASYMDRQLDLFNREISYFFSNERKIQKNQYPRFKFGENYNDSALKLLSYLNNGNENFNDTFILNFNYTKFNYIDFNNKDKKLHMLNIHGTLNPRSIIIGTDLRIINNGNDLIPFTKPFKIVNNYHGELSKYGIFKHMNSIDNIVFFGHSLGDTDFNYFKSIFDEVNLYEGTVNLTFYIPIYDISKRMQIISEHESNILKLLTKYSKTLSKIKEDDVSLFTKLLLEGRLHIDILRFDDYKQFNFFVFNQMENRQKESKKRVAYDLSQFKVSTSHI